MRSRARASGRRLATVLFVDMVSSTELAARLGDRRWHELLARYRRIVRQTLRRAGGREVDNAGDGFFAVFDEPTSAIACACALTDDLRTEGIEVRSGLHMGEVETEGGKLSGIGVHIGARVSAQAGPGQVVISGTLRDIISGSDYGLVDLGQHSLKGVPGEWRLYSVTWGDAEPLRERATTRRRLVFVAAGGAAVVAVLAFVLVRSFGGATTPHASPAIITVAGTGGRSDGPDGRPATATDIAIPSALALDSDGRLFIITGNRVRKINTDGTLTTIAGTGHAGFSGDSGPATSAELNSPQAIAVDSSGSVFIADTQNNRVRRVDPQGIISTFAGSRAPGFSGDGGPATEAQLSAPTGVAIGFGPTILIADTGNSRIRVVAADGVITTFAGSGDTGYAGDGGRATSAALNEPQCLAVDATDNVYIADTLNNRVRRVTVDGTISTIAGTGDQTFSGDGGAATNAGMHLASGPLSGGGCLAVDHAGDLFIADALNNRVREVSVRGGVITTTAGTGQAGYAGDNGPATSAELGLPLGWRWIRLDACSWRMPPVIGYGASVRLGERY
jgi:class 3 adenylate cyclase